MSGQLDAVCLDGLRLLRTLAAENVEAEAARAQVAALQARHPGVRLDLVWDREPFAGTLHYDLLVRGEGLDAVWLGWCPDRGIPWAFRGAHRHREADLVRVDGFTLRVDSALQLIDYIWSEERILHGLVEACLIQRAFFEFDVAVPTDAELQLEMDEFRRRRGLLTSEATLGWLRQHGMTYERLEFYVADAARVRRLRQTVVGSAVEPYLAAHRSEWAHASLALLDTPHLAVAAELTAGRSDDLAGFLQLAAHAFAAGRIEAPRMISSYRDELPEPIAAFVTEPGLRFGPVVHADRHHVGFSIAVRPAQLDEATREAITKKLFAQWLTERRQAARIEWLWGREQGIEGA